MEPVPSGEFKLPGADQPSEANVQEPTSPVVNPDVQSRFPSEAPQVTLKKTSVGIQPLGFSKTTLLSKRTYRSNAPAGDAETRLHIKRYGHSMGPYNKAQMEELMEEGKLLSTDLYCLEGSEEWHPLVEWPHWLPMMLEVKQHQRYDRHTVQQRPIDTLITILCWIFLLLSIAAGCGFWLSLEGK